jgi:predicted secreted hydrolase
VRVDGVDYEVEGTSWFDKEFSTSSLGADQVGWDWFSIQLDSGEEVMLYQLRNKEGKADTTSSGTFVGADGKAVNIANGAFTLDVLKTWKSSRTGATYPAQWHLQIPGQKLDLLIEPKLADQELVLKGLKPMSYWEGTCRISGQRDGKPVSGAGYTELTGYSGSITDGLR